VWKFHELPPSALIKSLDLEQAAVDQDELVRAKWFWSGRPKALWESLGFFFFLCDRRRILPDSRG
jgi:hypothetical protein